MDPETRNICCILLALSMFASFDIAFARTEHPTNVDRLVSSLDSVAANAYVNDWRVSPDFSTAVLGGDPTEVCFDDALWKKEKLGDEISLDSCWIRKGIILPNSTLGKEIHGKVDLYLRLVSYGYMWIGGYFPFDREFVLTDDAKPVPFRGQHVFVDTKKNSTRTMKVYFWHPH